MAAVKIIAGIVLGGLGGFFYQRLVGCSSGACPLTSNPTVTTIYGAVMGLSVAMMR